MEFVRFVSKALNFNFLKHLLLILTVPLFLFNIFCIIHSFKFPQNIQKFDLFFNYHTGRDLLSEPTVRRTIDQFLAQMLIWAVLCIWVYAAPKFAKGHEELKNYLFEITGVRDEPFDDIPDGYIEEARELWEQQELWACTFPQIKAKERPGMSTLKIIYIFGWAFLLIIVYFIPVRQRYIPILDDCIDSLYRIQGCLTLITGILSVGICMFSWWCCMEFGFFISRVSALRSLTAPYGYTYLVKKRTRKDLCEMIDMKKRGRPDEDYLLYKRKDMVLKGRPDQKNYYFNPIHPSQTHALVRMLHDSTMTSMAFLIISCIFTVQYGCCVWAEKIHIGSSIVEAIWFITVIIPGIFSLFPVVICPKLFLLRIHRIWRMQLIKDYENELHYYTACNSSDDVLDRSINIREEREYWSKIIHEVEKDRIDVRNFEIIGAVLSILLNIGVFIASLIS